MHKSTKSRLRKAQGIRALPCEIEIAPGIVVTRIDIHKFAIDDDALGLDGLNADNDVAVNEAVLALIRTLRNRVAG